MLHLHFMAGIINLSEVDQFQNLEFLAKQVVAGFITGLHKSPFHGFSVEFSEHRLYNNGESIKNIDWKLYARSEKLFVKRFEEETNLRCHIVIDHSSSMFYPDKRENKLHFSLLSAAAIIQLLKRQRDAAGLSVMSDALEVHTPAKSNNVHLNFIYSEMEKLFENQIPNKVADIPKVLHQIAEAIHKRSLVVIFSDMFDNENSEKIFDALQHLRHYNNEVVLFHVTDKSTELDFDFEDRPYKFTDLESGEEVKVQAGDIKEIYKERISSLKHQLSLKCAQYGIDFVEADIKAGFGPVLQAYLVKRQKMA
ncbi:MAG: hypothetical protein ACI81S_001902 [Sphingobacteriales bacterium]